MAEPLRVNTDQVRAHLKREPARTRGCARLIRALCDEIDRLRDDRGRSLQAERLRPIPDPPPWPPVGPDEARINMRVLLDALAEFDNYRCPTDDP